MRRQNDKEQSKQVRICAEMHKKLKVMSAEKGVSVKTLLEGMIEGQVKES